MAVLYRKYRPQTFAEVVNQKPIVSTLLNQVKSDSVAHAYLFTGSRGVGKTSVARILAKAVNCLRQVESEKLKVESTGDACGICDNCRAIAAGGFLDLVEIDAASNTGVDNIRELIEYVKFSPSSGKYKVFIIDEAHMLSKGAFNALLKTLEEPPKHAIFVLATTEINKVPATIISRTQRFDFKALSAADILRHLKNICEKEGVAFTDGILELVAQNAEGSARDSLSLLEKLLSLGQSAGLEDAQALLGITDLASCENLLELVVLGKAEEVPNFFASLSEKGLDYSMFNRDYLEYLRKVLIYKITEGKIQSNIEGEHRTKLSEFTKHLSISEIIFTIRLFLKSYKDLSGAPSPEIPLLLAGVEAAIRRSEVGGRRLEGQSSGSLQAEKSENRKLESIEPVSPPVILSNMNEVVEQSVEILSPENLLSTLDEVQEFWPKVIAKVKAVNGPLASMLKNARLLSVERGRVNLGVKFSFDKQNVENPKNLSLICGFIEESCGKKIGLSAQVIKEVVTDSLGTTEVLAEALKVFGGELID